MKPQEVVTIFSEIPNDAVSRTYPELDSWFNKGMYIEDFTQTQVAPGKYIITFILRYYSTSTSKDKN